MRNPSRTRAAVATFAAAGAIVGMLLALAGGGDAPVAAALHGALLGALSGVTAGLCTVVLLLSDVDRVFRR